MSLFNSLNNITTDKITIKDNSIVDIVPEYTEGQTIDDKIHKLPTVKFIEDFVDIQDNNYAKKDSENEFAENNTFNKNIIVAKNNETIVASLTIDGNSIAVTDSVNNTNTITIQNTTISTTESTDKDTLTTDNIVTDSIKIPNNSSYTITSITGSSESGRSNNSLPTKDYVDDKIATDLTNCAKKNEANTFENGYTQTFNGAVDITNTLTTTGTVNANNGITTSTGNLNLSSTGKTINLGNKESDPTKIETSSDATPVDTLTTDNLSLRSNLSVIGTSTLTGNTTISGTLTVNNASTLAGNVIMGSKQSGQTTLTTTSGVDTFTTDKVVVGTVNMSNGNSGTYDITSIQGSATTGADNTKLTTKGYVDDITASLSNYAKLDDNNTFVANKTQTFSGPISADGGIQTTAGTLYLGNQSTTSNKTKLESVISGTPADTLTTDNLTLRNNLSVSGTSTLTGDVTIGSKSSNPTTIITSSDATPTDTLTTDNLTLRNNLTVNGETTLTSPVYFGSKSTGKSSLITDQNNYDKFTTDYIDILQDLSVTGNTTLTGDLNVTGDLTTTGDVYLGQKEQDKTTIITTQIPGSSPAEYEDTLTTDNVVIRDSLTINGELEANLPQKYNYAYLYDSTNNYYTYNNINYEYDTTNHNFKVIGFRNNKNNTFIIEPYLLIEETISETIQLNKYPVVDVDISEGKFEYTVNNIDTYIYLPDNFDYIMCANLLNKITSSSISNIYISISFKYDLYINCIYEYIDSSSTTQTINTELNFTNKKIYYIIRNPNNNIDINNIDIWKEKRDFTINNMIGLINSNDSLYIINLSNINNAYIGYNTFNESICNDYHLTSKINILENKIIENHYNMYLNMQSIKENYYNNEKYDKLIYIKQFDKFTSIPSKYYITKIYSNPNPDNDIEPSSGGNEIINFYMNDIYKINWIKYNNTNKIITLYLSCISSDGFNNNYHIIKLTYNYNNYSLDNLKQCYIINNFIYLLFSADTNTNRLLFLFDLNDFNNKHLYLYNDALNTGEGVPDKIIFNFNNNNNNYELYWFVNSFFYKLLLDNNDNTFYSSYAPISDLNISYNIIDICYIKPYIIFLTKDISNNKYRLYYCSNFIKKYYQFYDINLDTLSSGEYYLNMSPNNNNNYTDKEYECQLYILNNDHSKGVIFNSYNIENLLMRI